jgi:hypothetical protein
MQYIPARTPLVHEKYMHTGYAKSEPTDKKKAFYICNTCVYSRQPVNSAVNSLILHQLYRGSQNKLAKMRRFKWQNISLLLEWTEIHQFVVNLGPLSDNFE